MLFVNSYENCVYVLDTSGIMSRLFGYTSAAVDRDAAAVEAFETKKIEAKENYWFVFTIAALVLKVKNIYQFNLKNY